MKKLTSVDRGRLLELARMAAAVALEAGKTPQEVFLSLLDQAPTAAARAEQEKNVRTVRALKRKNMLN